MLQEQQILQERYRLRESLGNNAGRQTWVADDLSTTSDGQFQKIVLKLLAFSPQMEWDEYKLFEREGKILRSLNHPRIPRYQDYFSLEKPASSNLCWFCLVQDYIPGNSLQKLLSQGTRFTLDQVESIARQLLEILTYLHGLETPVLHRDIKPSNLILTENQEIYLVDFGAVQDPTIVEGCTFTVVGTAGYAPLEQFWGKALPASDLYAVGATVIHLLTGVAPMDLPQQDLRIQFSDRVSIPPSFLTWVETLVEPDLEQRFSSAKQALEALDNPNQLPSKSQSLAVPDSKILLRRTQQDLLIKIPKGKRGWKNILNFLVQTTLALSSLLVVAIPLLGLTILIIAMFFEMLAGNLKSGVIVILMMVSGFLIWSFQKIRRQFGQIFKQVVRISNECFSSEMIQGSGNWITLEGISSQSVYPNRGHIYPLIDLRSVQYLPFQGILLKIADQEYHVATQVSESEREWVYQELQSWLKQQSKK